MKLSELDRFTRRYLECALWSSTGLFDQPLDKTHSLSDFTEQALEIAARECARFKERAGDLLDVLADSEAGFNFWLSRNGHGAGFFDDGHDELQALAGSFGECDVDTLENGQLTLHSSREVWRKIVLDRVAVECFCDA